MNKLRLGLLAVAAILGSTFAAFADDAAELAAAQEAFKTGDYAKMIPLLQALADRGNGEGLRAMAVVYLRGQGVPKDEAKGATWMAKAANAGLASAQHELGLLYLNGVGVEKNTDTAKSWFQKAAAQDIGVSWQVLGRIATEGKDTTTAEDNYRKASELGVVGAMLDLAQNLMVKAAAAPAKADAMTALTEAYRWIQTSLTAVPSGPQRDEVHRIRAAIEDEVTKRDAAGAKTTLAAAKVDGEAKAKELRAKAQAQADAAAAKAKTANAPPAKPN